MKAQNSIILESVRTDGLGVMRRVQWRWFEVHSMRFDYGVWVAEGREARHEGEKKKRNRGFLIGQKRKGSCLIGREK